MTDAMYQGWEPERDCRVGRADPAAPPGAARLRTTGSHALDQGRNRLLVAAAALSLAFVAVGARLVDATLMHRSGAESNVAQSTPAGPPQAGRADIVDRNGVLLATSLATASLYADPAQVIDPVDAARKLVSVLPELNYNELLEKLKSDKRFVWIKRNLAPKQHYAVNRLGIPGLAFQREEHRVYPSGPLTAHVIGYTGVDNSGLAGLEQQFDKLLRSSNAPLQTSLDIRIQHILKKEVQAATTQFNALGGAGMVYDVNTGEVLALVSLPDFDPQEPSGAGDEARFNRNTLGVYEMGSTFKIFNSAMALESGLVRMHDSFDATRPIHVGRFTISDYHAKNRWMTVPEIFMHSSNIGSVKMALTVGINGQKAFMGKMGFLRPPPLELPEMGAPLVPNPWREVNAMTIAFGHGMSVSPVHLVAATASVINGGVMHPPTLLRRQPGAELPGERVVSPQTSALMRKLFRLVVAEGTATAANAPGYLVGGKTGTAEKSSGKHYSQNARLSSFIGAFPMHDPRYIVFVMIDEPKGTRETHGYATGGWVAAPAVGRVVKQIGSLLGVPTVDETNPEIRRAMEIDTRPAAKASLATYRSDGRPH